MPNITKKACLPGTPTFINVANTNIVKLPNLESSCPK